MIANFVVACHVCDQNFVTFDPFCRQPLCTLCAIAAMMDSDEVCADANEELPQVCACPNEVEAAPLPIPEGWEHL